jgi:hypothetical protein
MMMDIDQAAKAMREEGMLAKIEDFLEGFNQPTCGSMGFGSRLGHPRTGGPGTARCGMVPMKLGMFLRNQRI